MIAASFTVSGLRRFIACKREAVLTWKMSVRWRRRLLPATCGEVQRNHDARRAENLIFKALSCPTTNWCGLRSGTDWNVCTTKELAAFAATKICLTWSRLQSSDAISSLDILQKAV